MMGFNVHVVELNFVKKEKVNNFEIKIQNFGSIPQRFESVLKLFEPVVIY